MNLAHALVCSSRWWAGTVERKLVPWGLAGVELGDDRLEIGPGFGATTRVLAGTPGSLTVVELSEAYCRRLRRMLGDGVAVVQADATAMPFADSRFTGIACFTMLHHVPSHEQQDRLLAEASRVLRPGGMFAGTDSIGTGRMFRMLHVGDTLVPVGPSELPARLEQAGFIEPRIETAGSSFRFRARKPTDRRASRRRPADSQLSARATSRQATASTSIRPTSASTSTPFAFRAGNVKDDGGCDVG